MNREEYKKEIEKQQMELLKKAATLKYMTKEARERLNHVKIIKPELAEKVEVSLLQAIQAGQIRNRISESQIIKILEEINERKKFRIIRK
jgi:programmed cell death protein 5